MKIGKLKFPDNTQQLTAGVYTPGQIVYAADADPFWADTTLAMHMNDLVDLKNSVVTKSGSAVISTSQFKFGTASGYFPAGAANHFSIPASNALNVGQSDFTIDFWVRLDSVPAASAYQFLLCQRTNYNSNESFTFAFYGDTPGTLLIMEMYDSVNAVRAGASVPFTTFAWAANTWYHIAFVRSGTSLKTYVDGSVKSAVTVAATFTVCPSTVPMLLGGEGGSVPLKGYIDDLRITKAARWTADFTPPTAAFPHALVSNTVQPIATQGDPFWSDVILSMDMNTLKDRRGKTITANGNAVISTAQSKFGGSSLFLDGTADWVDVGYTTEFNLKPSVGLTIEAWIYIADNSSLDGNSLRHGTIFGITQAGSQTQMNLWVRGDATTTGTGIEVEYANNADYSSGRSQTVAISQGVWHHIALCMDQTSTRFYIDGVQYTQTAAAFDILWSGSITLSIGRAYPDTGVWARMFNGYIDDLRITRASRYTANFTPPVAAFPSFSYQPIASTPVYEEGVWTPTWVAASGTFAIGDGTLTGRYTRIGNLVTININMVPGSTTTFGSAHWTIGLPPGLVPTSSGPISVLAWDTSGNVGQTGLARIAAGSSTFYVGGDGQAEWHFNVPFTWAATDAFRLQGSYFV